MWLLLLLGSCCSCRERMERGNVDDPKQIMKILKRPINIALHDSIHNTTQSFIESSQECLSYRHEFSSALLECLLYQNVFESGSTQCSPRCASRKVSKHAVSTKLLRSTCPSYQHRLLVMRLHPKLLVCRQKCWVSDASSIERRKMLKRRMNQWLRLVRTARL